MSNIIVQTTNLCKNYTVGNNEIQVLKDINLTIEEGEFASIMGPSGSGKSTLLYILGGLEYSTTGTVLVKGIDIAKQTDELQSQMRRQNIGFVFQAYNLIPNLTVEENILLPLQLDKKKNKDILPLLDNILDIVDLNNHRKHTPSELSGGQQQRVSIARAVITSPDIIFADEPIGNLDSKNGTEILKLLKKINQTKHTTIVMVTHSLESTRYGTRIINLKDGEIVS